MEFYNKLTNNNQSIILSVISYALYGIITLLTRYVLQDHKITPCSMLILRSLFIFIGLALVIFLAILAIGLIPILLGGFSLGNKISFQTYINTHYLISIGNNG